MYTKLPEPFPKLFEVLDDMLPGYAVSDSVEGVYESETKHLGFHKHFIITKDAADDTKLSAIKYRGAKSSTDDHVKLLEKEITEMKDDALNPKYEHKSSVEGIDGGYKLFDIDAKRDGTTLIFKSEKGSIKYFKIRDL
jgi:hypothetical protein